MRCGIEININTIFELFDDGDNNTARICCIGDGASGACFIDGSIMYSMEDACRFDVSLLIII